MLRVQCRERELRPSKPASAAVSRFILYNKISIWLLLTVARNSRGNDAFRRDILPSLSLSPPPTNGHSVSNTPVMPLCYLYIVRWKTCLRPFCHPGRRFLTMLDRCDTCASNRIEIDPVFSTLKNRSGRRRSNTCKWKSLAFTRLGLLSNKGDKYYSNVLSATITMSPLDLSIYRDLYV